jgi:hypothetical protein
VVVPVRVELVEPSVMPRGKGFQIFPCPLRRRYMAVT